MKITIYELLGLIKDGKAPEKIKYENSIYELSPEDDDYYFEDEMRWFTNELNCLRILNDEVKIIEDQNKIDNLMPKHLSNEFIQQIDKCITLQDIKCIAHKVNEVINYLQHINKEEQ